MFENILIAISSEFYSKELLEQGAMLTKKFQSKVTIIYIIEQKTLFQTENRSDTFRTRVEKDETKNIIIKSQMQTADTIVFFDAKSIFKNIGVVPEFKIQEGEFSATILNELKLKQFDVVLMGYEKVCMLKYRILDDINIPLWVNGKTDGQTVLAICSNLTPNQKIPEISQKLAHFFNWGLQVLYIVDIEENITYDEATKRFIKKPVKELLADGQHIVDTLQQKGITATMMTGSLEEKTIRSAKQFNAGLIVIGQEHKRYDKLGFSMKTINHKIVEKCKYSLLFLN